jgi:hypothetical protein
VAMGVVWAWKIFERMAASPDAGPYDFALDLLSSISITGVVSGLFACVLGLPAMSGRGFRVTRRAWCLAGIAAGVAYLLASAGAHAVALRRVEDFAQSRGLQIQNIGALPMPPSFLFWSGMISTREKVYYSYFSLLDAKAPQFREYQQLPLDAQVQKALALPDVQIVLRFFRFPFIREVNGHWTDVNFYDVRFLPQAGKTFPFGYRVSFDKSTGQIRYRGKTFPYD